jgi:formate dehydrogenase major subunit
MALRGHSTIQGATDLSTLYDTLPGYLLQPAAYDRTHEDLSSYIEHEGMQTGYWANFSKFIVSLLKAWYGDAATPDNDFGFSWLPRVDADYSALAYFDRMAKGEVKGYFLTGQNPGGGGPNAGLHRAGLRNLDWLVVLDWFETESAVLWKNDPNAPPPSQIKTEVFFIPVAAAPEKEGSLTNTQRLLQWHNKAVDPSGDRRSDAWFLYNLGKRLKHLYAGSTDPKDQPLLNLTWDYDFDEQSRLPDGTLSRIEGEPDLEKVLMEINGHRLNETDSRTGRPRLVSGFSELKDDGTTACGCWVYSGVFPEPGRNRANGRKITDDPFQPEMGLRLAEQCPRPVQPSLSRPRRAAMVGTQEIGLVGLREAALGRTRQTGLRAGQAARLPTASGRDGHGGHRRHPALHHEGRRTGLAVLPQRQGRACADALRAGRVAGGQPALSQTQLQPNGTLFRGTAQPHRPNADSRVSRGGHDVPSHRALLEWADEPLQ